MSNIQITIDSTQVEALLSHIKNKADHLEPALASIGQVLKERVRLTFTDLKTPDGVTWKPLSPVTKFNRAKRVGGGVYNKAGTRTTKKFTDAYLSANPLNDTGVLRDSIAYQLSGQAVEIGTNAPQAAMMNFGAKQGAFGKNKRNTPIPWGDVPARQFMPDKHLPVAWEQDVIKIVNDHLGIIE